MIVILYADDVRTSDAEKVQKELQAAYDNKLQITLIPEHAASSWPGDRAWDDLIILLFDSKELSTTAQTFLAREISSGGRERPLLPVSFGTLNVPPQPAERFKAMPINFPRLSRRVGAIMGMSLRNRDQIIFISYRAVDGTKIAVQLDEFLRSHGYNVWRDEAKDEFDNEGFIPPGRDVQEVIDENLKRADLILFIDSPRSAESKWIKLEIDAANGLLIPVLPVILRRPGERLLVSRFRSLASLQRGCLVENDGGELSDNELDYILEEMESFLMEVFRRKLRIPFLVEREFTDRGYNWNARDHIIYEALKAHNGLLRTRVYSHCSHFEGIFDPALVAFVRHLGLTNPAANYALYIYDGLVISNVQIDEIRQQARLDDNTNVIILHNQELAALLHTNFTSLSV